MKLIATWCSQPWLAGQGGKWIDEIYMFAAAKAAIHFAHKHFGRPLIYTDTLGKKILSTITNQADYEVVYDDLHKTVPKSLWAYAKIATYAAQKRPYLHFDLDFLFLEHPAPQLFMSDVVFQCIENLNEDEEKIYYNIDQFVHSMKLPDVYKKYIGKKVPTPNVGCLYMKDMELNKQYVETAQRLIFDNISLWREKKYPHMCVVEQQTLGIIMQERQSRYETLLPVGGTPWSENVVHFMGAAKRMKDYLKVLDPWITPEILHFPRLFKK